MKQRKLSISQLQLMTHTTKWDVKKNCIGNRNYFMYGDDGEISEEWKELVELGLCYQKSHSVMPNAIVFHVSEVGLQYLTLLFSNL